jgi:hypothetical protein
MSTTNIHLHYAQCAACTLKMKTTLSNAAPQPVKVSGRHGIWKYINTYQKHIHHQQLDIIYAMDYFRGLKQADTDHHKLHH